MLIISDPDVWRAADRLIQKYGADAEPEAAKNVLLMLERGDDEGRFLWARIRRAIEALQEPLHGKPN